VEKAVILAGGKGVRLGSMAENMPKPMAVIQGKPILHYIISMVRDMGMKQLYVVVGYKKEMLIDYFKDGKEYGIKIEYIDNSGIDDKKKSGLSDAVLLLKDSIKEPFMTILGDEIYAGTAHKAMLAEFEKRGSEAAIAVHRTPYVEEVKKNYAVRIDEKWNILDLEEKPQKPWNDLIGCGTYMFNPSIFGYIKKTPVSERSGRKELADTLKCMINDGKIVKAYDLGGKYLNINFAEDIETANKIIGDQSGNSR
jgi:UDP-N-acetylglucosamine diphosphorylase / glucose-1-phosphate thymidylyltransferase / UDP-N-acetylgalactosamine diphosphorylase / glucosamine-1-phosphate N-acetyltransferase / galactosamine-1-phosphate N-acetyltransferase